MMTNYEIDDKAHESVKDWMERFGVPVDLELQIDLVEEEIDELLEAMEDIKEKGTATHAKVSQYLKEHADVLFTLAGLTVMVEKSDVTSLPHKISARLVDATLLGLSTTNTVDVIESWVFGRSLKEERFEAFLRVVESNNSKVDDNGNPIRDEKGKIMKGPNYKPAQLDDIVRGLGYEKQLAA